jgi:subtilisin family serine protease
MNDADDTFAVDWHGEEWDDAILQQTNIGRMGRAGDWVMYVPGRLLVDARATEDRRITALLDDADVSLSKGPAARDVAAKLGLTVLNAPDDRLMTLVRDVRAVADGAASLDYVMTAGSQRWGGDDEPLPIGDPGTIPGSDTALGAGVRVAVLDTGISEDVPFGVEFGPGDLEVADSEPDGLRDKPAGHGTHMAGTIARIAPGSTIVARRVLTGPGGIASSSAVAAALLATGDADLINCSFSGPSLHDAAPIAIERALALLRPSTVVVACAGNRATDRPQWPAASKRVIAVGAVGRDSEAEDWKRADFSGYGPWVDCCAPGVAVPSTFLHYGDTSGEHPVRFDGFASWSGTSMSCSQVTGAIAALASQNGGDVSLAAYRLVRDPAATPRVGQLGPVIAA